MLIDPHSGVLSWKPLPGQEGEHRVLVRVRDTWQESALKEFTIAVAARNDPPVITSQPNLLAAMVQPYAYQIVAQCPKPNSDRRFCQTPLN